MDVFKAEFYPCKPSLLTKDPIFTLKGIKSEHLHCSLQCPTAKKIIKQPVGQNCPGAYQDEIVNE